MSGKSAPYPGTVQAMARIGNTRARTPDIRLRADMILSFGKNDASAYAWGRAHGASHANWRRGAKSRRPSTIASVIIVPAAKPRCAPANISRKNFAVA
jgi:hypothetical protein